MEPEYRVKFPPAVNFHQGLTYRSTVFTKGHSKHGWGEGKIIICTYSTQGAQFYTEGGGKDCQRVEGWSARGWRETEDGEEECQRMEEKR